MELPTQVCFSLFCILHVQRVP